MKQPEEYKHVWELVVVALLLLAAFKPKKPIGYIRGKVSGESLSKAHYRQYLQSSQWKALRAQKLKEALYRCQLCNSPGLLDVHHRHYHDLGHEDLRDLIVLCRECHERFRGKNAGSSS